MAAIQLNLHNTLSTDDGEKYKIEGLLEDPPKSSGPQPLLNHEDRIKVYRKLDFHLLPFIALLYLLSALDRSNIGNAKIAGMTTDLKLVGLKYNVAAAIFFVSYSFAEIPANIILTRTRPSRWIPSLMLAWGVIMTSMGLVNSYRGLVVARFFLGLAEAGIFPGLVYYLWLWYPRNMQASRVAIFFSASAISGAFGGILAYAIRKMEGIGGLHGWQWIFCLEGLVTVVVAISSYFYMDDYPETAKFLTEPERQFLVETLKADSGNVATHFEWKFVWQALSDYKTYILIGMYIGILIPLYTISLFMPTIINELGFSASSAQLLSAPPFFAGCICTLIVGIYSDRLKVRGRFIICCCSVALVGFIILYMQTEPRMAYIGAMFVAMGVLPCIPVSISWAGGNAGGSLKRAAVIAMVSGFAHLGGICSSFVYFQPPRFLVGHGTMIGCLTMSIILCSFTIWNFNRINKRKDEFQKSEGAEMKDAAFYKHMGDDSPWFRYTL